jgi:hypothetical protein
MRTLKDLVVFHFETECGFRLVPCLEAGTKKDKVLYILIAAQISR